jgi:hypothetical protein
VQKLSTPPEDDSRLLAGLITLADAPGHAGWTADDLAAIWRHQLVAPLMADLGSVAADAQTTVISVHAPLSIQSLAGLFAHPSPPLDVLRMVKDLSRMQGSRPETAYPQQVAVALYYLAIALGLVRLGRRMSTMDDARLRDGMEWVIQQAWLDQATRDIASEALCYLKRASRSDGMAAG